MTDIDLKTRVRQIGGIVDQAVSKERRNFRDAEVAAVIDAAKGTRFHAEMLSAASVGGGTAKRTEAMVDVAVRMADAAKAETPAPVDTRDQADVTDAETRTQEQRDAEIRALNERATRIVTAHHRNARGGKPEMEWGSGIPTPQEWRALISENTPSSGGFAVPEGVASFYIDKLRAQSVLLKAPGLQVIPFTTASFVIPQLATSSTPGVVAEGGTIPTGTATFNGLTFAPVKYASLYQASSEIIDDASISVADMIANTLIRDTAAQVDKDAFQGAGGTAGLLGLTNAANSVTTNLPTGTTVVHWDSVIDATANIMGIGGTPTVIWCSVDSWKALMKERTNVGGAGTGEYLAGEVSENPTNAALGLPLLPSGNLPARTVIVADATRVFYGVRNEVRLMMSLEFAFNQDITSWRLTTRTAGIHAAEPASVQVVVAAAS